MSALPIENTIREIVTSNNQSGRLINWRETNSAFAKSIRTVCVDNLGHIDPINFFNDVRLLFVKEIMVVIRKYCFIKIGSSFSGSFLKQSTSTEEESHVKYFTTKSAIITEDCNLEEWFDENVKNNLLQQFEEFQDHDRGWALHQILKLVININKYVPQNASSFIELPKEIKNKRACINVKNKDDACFAWSVMAALFPAKSNADRMSSYPHYNTRLKLDGITFPMTRQDITKFEELNSMSVNVYILKKKNGKLRCLPNRLTKNKVDCHINLLLIQNEYYEEDSDKEEEAPVPEQTLTYHYVLIKSLSRLLSSGLGKRKVYVCDRCLHYFRSLKKLKNHEIDCQEKNKCKVSFPKEDVIKFKLKSKKERVPMIIYVDMRCMLKPIEDQNNTSTEKYPHHFAQSVGYYVHTEFGSPFEGYHSLRGENCTSLFSEQLTDIAKYMQEKKQKPLPMQPLDDKEDISHKNAANCWICEKPFSSDHNKIKVRDHNHLTGKYRGAAHRDCNLHFHESFSIPVVFRNLTGYDSHLIIEHIAALIPGKTTVIPCNIEKFNCIRKKIAGTSIEFRFIDSFRFMSQSLDKWASYLNDLPLSRKQFHRRTHTDICSETDVMRLADVFENFRKDCLKFYKLDPTHYSTARSLSWDAMLLHTDCEIKLIKDIDILMFIERGFRERLTQCSLRYAESNNHHLSSFDGAKPEAYVMYFDINFMYAWAMSQFLPQGEFKWVDDITDLKWDVEDDSSIGYILEVDLDYPPNIHKRQSDLPMAPTSTAPPGQKQPKLMATLFAKEKYVVHYRNLKQYVKEGLIITTIHRALRFQQSPWLKPYIDLNAELRRNASNDFEKELFDLMNNAIFEKTTETVRNRRFVKLLQRWEGPKGAAAYIAKTNILSFIDFRQGFRQY